MKSITIRLDDELHKEFKVIMAKEESSITDFLIAAIKEKVQKASDSQENKKPKEN